MAKSIYFLFLIFVSAWELSNALTCYNCYKNIDSVTNFLYQLRDENTIPCANDIKDWNTYQCPGANPVCSKVYIKLGDSGVITRSCSSVEADICNNGIPGGVDLVSCDTCTTDLCNGETGDDPDVPNNSTCPVLTLDINLNVNLNVRNIN